MSGQVWVLTPRQLEILRLVANGYTAAQVAVRLGITRDTVNSSLRLIYRALGVGDRAHAAVVALRVGLLRPGEIHVPEQLRARLAPVGGSEAPGLRPSAAGASGGDGGGFNGPRKPSSSPDDSRSTPSEAENALHGGSPGLAASGRTTPASSP